MFQVVFEFWTIYEDVVEKHNDEASETRRQSGVHGALKCSRGSCQTECHDLEFILAQVCLESRLELLT